MSKSEPAAKHTLAKCFPTDSVVRDAVFTCLDEFDGAGAQSLVYCQTVPMLKQALRYRPDVSILTNGTLAKHADGTLGGLVVVETPREAFFDLYLALHAANHELLVNESWGVGEECQIHPSAVISPKSRIGNRVVIGAGAVVGDGSVVEDDCFIDAGVVIGAEGQFIFEKPSGRVRIPHCGGVRIERDCVILANSVIVRSLFPRPTTVGAETHVGPLASIGHGATVGAKCMVRVNSVIGGRCRIGSNTMIGMSASVVEGATVGADCQVKMGSVVVKNVGDGKEVSGNFAEDHRKHVERSLKR